MKKSVIIVVVIVAAFALLFFMYGRGLKSEILLEDLVGSAKEVVNENLGISFRVPADWVESIQKADNETVLFTAQSPDFNATLLGKPGDIPPRFLYSNGAIMNGSSRREGKSGWKNPTGAIGETTLSIEGVDVAFYRMRPDNTLENANLYQAHFSRNEKEYTFNFGHSGNYQNGEKVFRAIIQSIRFTPTP